jgi:hypothetical protein
MCRSSTAVWAVQIQLFSCPAEQMDREAILSWRTLLPQLHRSFLKTCQLVDSFAAFYNFRLLDCNRGDAPVMSLRNSLQRLIRLDGRRGKTFADFLNLQHRHHTQCLLPDADPPVMSVPRLHSWRNTHDTAIPIIVICAADEPEVGRLVFFGRESASLIERFTALTLLDAVHSDLKRPAHKSGAHSART